MAYRVAGSCSVPMGTVRAQSVDGVNNRFAEGSATFSAMAGGNVTNMQNYYPWTKDKAFNWQNDATNRLGSSRARKSD